MKILHDNFGNTATIKNEKHYPYRGSTEKEDTYVLTLTADYDDNCVYFVSFYETEQEAMSKLTKFSCNTWK